MIEPHEFLRSGHTGRCDCDHVRLDTAHTGNENTDVRYFVSRINREDQAFAVWRVVLSSGKVEVSIHGAPWRESTLYRTLSDVTSEMIEVDHDGFSID